MLLWNRLHKKWWTWNCDCCSHSAHDHTRVMGMQRFCYFIHSFFLSVFLFFFSFLLLLLECRAQFQAWAQSPDVFFGCFSHGKPMVPSLCYKKQFLLLSAPGIRVLVIQWECVKKSSVNINCTLELPIWSFTFFLRSAAWLAEYKCGGDLYTELQKCSNELSLCDVMYYFYNVL